MSSRCEEFRGRLNKGDLLVGTFLKTPSAIVAEVLGLTELDVVCIDAEHAPFGRLEIDACVAALRAADMPSLIRVPSDSPHDIRNALDCGATGILVPHVTSPQQAVAIVKASRFGAGGRGYAGSTRAAGYTTKPMKDHLSDSQSQTTVVLQIEDMEALDHTRDIASVEGVDAVFVGRVDLAVAMQEPVSGRPIVETVERICRDAGGTAAAVGMFTPNLDEIPNWRDRGASLFLLGSEHNFILSGARELAQKVRS